MARFRTLPSQITKKVPPKLIGKSTQEIREWASQSLYDKGVNVDLNRDQVSDIKKGTLKEVILKPKVPIFFKQNLTTGEISVVKSIDVKLEIGEDFEEDVKFEEEILIPWLNDELDAIIDAQMKSRNNIEKIWIYYNHIKKCKEFINDNHDRITKAKLWDKIRKSGKEVRGKMNWYFIWSLLEWLPDLSLDSPEFTWGEWTLTRLVQIKDKDVREYWRHHLLEGTFNGVRIEKLYLVIKPFIGNGELITEIQNNINDERINEKQLNSILKIHNTMNNMEYPNSTDIENLRGCIK